MRTGKNLLLIVISILMYAGIISCGSSRNGDGTVLYDDNPPFQVTKSYLQPWVAGTIRGGSGIDVHLELTYDEGAEVIFDKLYFRGMVKEVSPGNRNPDGIVITFKDHEGRPDIIMSDDPVEESVNLPADHLRFDMEDNQAVISYMTGRNTGYYKLDSIPEKEMLSYPGVPPNDDHEP